VEVGDSTGASIVDAKVTSRRSDKCFRFHERIERRDLRFSQPIGWHVRGHRGKARLQEIDSKGCTVESNKVAEAKVALELGEVRR